jgi:hypothetical protein
LNIFKMLPSMHTSNSEQRRKNFSVSLGQILIYEGGLDIHDYYWETRPGHFHRAKALPVVSKRSLGIFSYHIAASPQYTQCVNSLAPTVVRCTYDLSASSMINGTFGLLLYRHTSTHITRRLSYSGHRKCLLLIGCATKRCTTLEQSPIVPLVIPACVGHHSALRKRDVTQ